MNLGTKMIGNDSLKRKFGDVIEKHRPHFAFFETVYKDLHKHPELSTLESRTVALVAAYLEHNLQFTTHQNIGGTGVVGVFENGTGWAIQQNSKTEYPSGVTRISAQDGKPRYPGGPHSRRCGISECANLWSRGPWQ